MVPAMLKVPKIGAADRVAVHEPARINALIQLVNLVPRITVVSLPFLRCT